MTIHLPQENWNDVFGFVPRPYLAKVISQIGDWYFATKVQFYLHECGKITIGFLRIIKSAYKNYPVILKDERELPLPDVPMPGNIKQLNGIHISYYDQSVAPFLGELNRNLLLANINVNLDYDGRKLIAFDAWNGTPSIEAWTFTANFVPSTCPKVNSIYVPHTLLPRFQSNPVPIVTSARTLKTHYNSRDDWLCNWLKTPRPDGRPRVLHLFPNGVIDYPTIASFIQHIKKDFLEAKKAISFFINFKYFQLNGPNPLPISYLKVTYFFELDSALNCLPICLENIHTGEKLVIRKDTRKYGAGHSLWISRYPMNSNAEWIEQMAKYEEYADDYPTITIDFSSNYY